MGFDPKTHCPPKLISSSGGGGLLLHPRGLLWLLIHLRNFRLMHLISVTILDIGD